MLSYNCFYNIFSYTSSLNLWMIFFIYSTDDKYFNNIRKYKTGLDSR